MTLTVAINIDDYIILTGDHRLTIECEPFTGLPTRTVVDDYKKIKYWKYGAITVSGDVLLMYYFHEVLEFYAKQNNWDFLQVAQVARAMYLNDDKPEQHATGTAFFSLFTLGKVEIIHLSIKKNYIEYETIKPMHAHFSLFEGTPDDPIYQLFVNSLRKIDSFLNFEDFYNYHTELLRFFYTRQKRIDDSITSSFDLFIQNTKTGQGFMQTIEN
ncbi:hypothetical protein ACQUFW_13290 [Acinetobacter johnsonii]|jgi:hypothetical protein|uniref:hypothetical protein n=1 Tax=Acinetobacter johnsonii TaxID=40214 RepID=UPI003D17EA2E